MRRRVNFLKELRASCSLACRFLSTLEVECKNSKGKKAAENLRSLVRKYGQGYSYNLGFLGEEEDSIKVALLISETRSMSLPPHTFISKVFVISKSDLSRYEDLYNKVFDYLIILKDMKEEAHKEGVNSLRFGDMDRFMVSYIDSKKEELDKIDNLTLFERFFLVKELIHYNEITNIVEKSYFISKSLKE